MSLRLVSGVFALTVLAPLVQAGDAKSPPSASAAEPARSKVALRVVRVMPESHQALLFDRVRATYLLAELGGTVDGYAVEDIDDEQVTLRSGDKLLVLVAAPRGDLHRYERDGDRTDPAVPRSVSARRTGEPVASVGDPGPSGPIDPYAESSIRAVSATAPVSRDAEAPVRTIEPGDGGIRVVQAPNSASGAAAARPIQAGDDGVRVAQAPGSAGEPAIPVAPSRMMAPSSARPISAAPTSDARAMADAMSAEHPARSRQPGLDSGPVPSGSTVAGADAAGSPELPSSVVLTRSEVDRALSDFARLTQAIRGQFTAAGAVVLSVSDGSVFQRVGLLAGDVIATVDGVRLRSLDDAAGLYARASSAKALTAQIVRGGKPVTLHVTIQ